MPMSGKNKFKISMFFGHTEIKQFNKFENGKMVSYGYSITYDREGVEVSRTEPSSLGSIGWSDGSPFTKQDRDKIEGVSR